MFQVLVDTSTTENKKHKKERVGGGRFLSVASRKVHVGKTALNGLMQNAVGDP